MGGSLALALKEKYPHASIHGFARSRASFKRLTALALLDKVERDPEALVSGSDIVILALPIYSVIEYIKKIAPYLGKGTIVIDLGSSKALIESTARKLLPRGVDFVGCHPLCGSEKSGAEYARAALYKNTLCVITCAKKNRATRVITKMWNTLGAKVICVSSRAHDRLLSAFSHLPHLVAFSLTAGAPTRVLPLIPASFKELTRISGSPAQVWADIFVSNKENVLRDIGQFIKRISLFQRLIRKEDRKKLVRFIERINRTHKKITQYYS